MDIAEEDIILIMIVIVAFTSIWPNVLLPYVYICEGTLYDISSTSNSLKEAEKPFVWIWFFSLPLIA